MKDQWSRLEYEILSFRPLSNFYFIFHFFKKKIVLDLFYFDFIQVTRIYLIHFINILFILAL